MTLFMIIASILLGLISLDYRMTLFCLFWFSPFIFLDIHSKVHEYRFQQYLNWLIEEGRKEKEEKKGGVPDADH